MGKLLQIPAFLLLCSLSCIVLAVIPDIYDTGEALQLLQPKVGAPGGAAPLSGGESFAITAIKEGQGVELDTDFFGNLESKSNTKKLQKKDCLACGGLSSPCCSDFCYRRGYRRYGCSSCYCNCA